jgi:hypothetical protein
MRQVPPVRRTVWMIAADVRIMIGAADEVQDVEPVFGGQRHAADPAGRSQAPIRCWISAGKAPADRAQRGDAALDHVARLGAGHLHRPGHGVRAVGVAVAQRLAVGERHAVDGFVAPVRPGVGIADGVAGRDRGNGLGCRVQKAGADRLRRRLDRVHRGHCVSVLLGWIA